MLTNFSGGSSVNTALDWNVFDNNHFDVSYLFTMGVGFLSFSCETFSEPTFPSLGQTNVYIFLILCLTLVGWSICQGWNVSCFSPRSMTQDTISPSIFPGVLAHAFLHLSLDMLSWPVASKFFLKWPMVQLLHVFQIGQIVPDYLLPHLRWFNFRSIF